MIYIKTKLAWWQDLEDCSFQASLICRSVFLFIPQPSCSFIHHAFSHPLVHSLIRKYELIFALIITYAFDRQKAINYPSIHQPKDVTDLGLPVGGGRICGRACPLGTWGLPGVQDSPWPRWSTRTSGPSWDMKRQVCISALLKQRKAQMCCIIRDTESNETVRAITWLHSTL